MTSRHLVDFAQSINLPFEFIPLIQNLDSLKPNMLQLRTGEAFVVNCMLQFRGLLEEAPVALESFLGMLYSLNPRVVTLAEREMSNNQPIFLDRFADALNHYSTLFDSLDATLPVATPLWPSVKVKLNTPKVGDLESSGTPECLEFDSKAQNTSHWGVLSVIGKVLKRRYGKWPRIGHLDICSSSYGQKKGRESNWQFDS
jgi:hypothetical protein